MSQTALLQERKLSRQAEEERIARRTKAELDSRLRGKRPAPGPQSSTARCRDRYLPIRIAYGPGPKYRLIDMLTPQPWLR